MKQYIVPIIMFLVLVSLVSFVVIIIAHHEPKPKITEYKPQQSTKVVKKKDDEDDCTYTMCNAFGGGIAGDTLAIQFMNGD